MARAGLWGGAGMSVPLVLGDNGMGTRTAIQAGAGVSAGIQEGAEVGTGTGAEMGTGAGIWAGMGQGYRQGQGQG